MSKAVLIDPRGWQGAVSGHGPFPNVGIAYLVPMLQKHGHDVRVIDLNNQAMTAKTFIVAAKTKKEDAVPVVSAKNGIVTLATK